jgi:hypothetical protein
MGVVGEDDLKIVNVELGAYCQESQLLIPWEFIALHCAFNEFDRNIITSPIFKRFRENVTVVASVDQEHIVTLPPTKLKIFEQMKIPIDCNEFPRLVGESNLRTTETPSFDNCTETKLGGEGC